MKQIYMYAIILGIIILGVITLTLISRNAPMDINYNLKYADYNDRITLNYELSVDNEIIDSSYDRNKPFSFVIGEGQVIKGFDSGVLGLTEGQSKTIVVSPEDGYGVANEFPKKFEDNLQDVLNSIKEQLGEDVNAESIQDGTFYSMGMFCKFDGYDLNTNKQFIGCQHELAGKTLTFKVNILTIEKPNELNDLNN